MNDEQGDPTKVTRSARWEPIQGGSFKETRPRNGIAVFRASRIGESIGLLIAAAMILPFGLLVLLGGQELWSLNVVGYSLVCLVIGFIATGIGILTLGLSLRGAYTSEALLIDPSTRCLRWTKRTPFSAESDALSMDQMSAVLVQRHSGIDDDGDPFQVWRVSILRLGGEEWLGVASFSSTVGGVSWCDDEARAINLASRLILLTGSRMELRMEDPPAGAKADPGLGAGRTLTI